MVDTICSAEERVAPGSGPCGRTTLPELPAPPDWPPGRSRWPALAKAVPPSSLERSPFHRMPPKRTHAVPAAAAAASLPTKVVASPLQLMPTSLQKGRKLLSYTTIDRSCNLCAHSRTSTLTALRKPYCTPERCKGVSGNPARGVLESSSLSSSTGLSSCLRSASIVSCCPYFFAVHLAPASAVIQRFALFRCTAISFIHAERH